MRSFAPLVATLAVASLLALSAYASPEAPAFTNYASPTGLSAGEPSIGVNPHTGATFFQGFSATRKVSWSASGAATWTDVTPPSNRIMPNNDPLLATDPVTGRTFAGGLTPGFCSDFAYTDDDGATWVPFTLACPLLSSDHPTVGAGPWRAPAPATAAAFPSAVYVCQQSGADRCVVSQDGGLTYGAPVAIAGCTSFHGHVKVAPDGVAYVPSAYCGSQQGGFKTLTNGASWVAYRIPGSHRVANGGGFDPSLAITPDNAMYEAWSDGLDFHPWVARSTDHGASWERAVDLANTTTPPLRVSTFQAVVAGDNDRVAVAFLGSTDGTGNPFSASFAGTWDLFVSFTYDGGLTWETVKATSDPVQRGCIWDVVASPQCHRNLLDFMDASVSADGRVLVAYADGCTSATCKGPNGTTASSGDDWGTIARQTAGPRLYAAFD